MKKLAFLFALLGMMSIVGCGGTDCDDGSTPDADGNCADSGDDDTTAE